MRTNENENINQPVRQVPLSHAPALRGKVASQKNGRQHNYESSLEGDYLNILEFDLLVSRYCEQPVTIEYTDGGILRQYTPDVLVYYRQDLEPSKKFRPTLCEVKYRKDLKANWPKYKPKFAAALRFADKHGWNFKIMTEVEIRTPYLTNVHFLREYVNQHENIDMADLLLLESLLKDIRHTSPEELLLMATQDKAKRAELLYTLWYMVANFLVSCDLSKPLNLQSEIWVN